VDEAWTERYLALLGLGRGPPDYETLSRITEAQFRVPFENVTSMIRRVETPQGPVPGFDLNELLDAWEQGRGGGVCYEIAEMQLNLLTGLGYDATPIHAQVAFPGSHQAILVRLDGQRYMVDCGNASPFLQPIPLGGEFVVAKAGLSYRFRHETDEVVWQDRLIDGDWRPFCRYELREASRAARDEAFQRHHRLPAESFVVSELRVVKAVGDDLLQLTDHDYTRHTAHGRTKRRLESDADFVSLMRDEFELSNLPILEGLRALRALKPS
jgi:N-hydroxyarylamine O-acetyltransferase